MLVKYNNNSISAITTAGQLASGSMVLISEQTASASATISFTSGIDSTYPIYKFEFINVHSSTDTNGRLTFNMSTDGGSNYNVTKTSTYFYAAHAEDGSATEFVYREPRDLAQSTSFQDLASGGGADDDQGTTGYIFLFAPSSTTFVKHFISSTSEHNKNDYEVNNFIAGYGNTTSAVDAIRFQMGAGNIDAGTFKLYGIRDS